MLASVHDRRGLRQRRALPRRALVVVDDRRGPHLRPARRRCSTTCSGMPIAFFTRTQTGALISRMNNDVIGAQRAVTSTLGIGRVERRRARHHARPRWSCLEWRLTLLALVLLPIFIIPAKRIGRRLQAITREGFDLNASMNTTMTERFNVSGALLVKLFGTPRRRVRRLRRPGRPGPRHRRAQRDVRPRVLHRARPRRRGRHRGRLLRRRHTW